MTLSVVIPAWTGTEKLADLTLRLCQYVRPMCDQLVVSEDGNYSFDLDSIADIYDVHERLGHARNLALGVSLATSEYVALIDSDMEILSGDLRDLCIPNTVVSPSSVQNRFDETAGWFVVCPRSFVEEFPVFDQPTQGIPEGIDVWTRDFHARYRDKFQASDKLVAHHGRGGSYGPLTMQLRAAAAEAGPDTTPRREIMWDRHQQRLAEDPEYREMFGE